MKTALIVAMAKNKVIGLDSKMPWHFSSDLKYFKNATLNHAIIMGRKTYDSIGSPLAKRDNIIITRNKEFLNLTTSNNLSYINSLNSAIEKARNLKHEKAFIIGGSSIYSQAIESVKLDELFITQINNSYDGDTFFPYCDMSQYLLASSRKVTEKNVVLDFQHWIIKNQ